MSEHRMPGGFFVVAKLHRVQMFAGPGESGVCVCVRAGCWGHLAVGQVTMSGTEGCAQALGRVLRGQGSRSGARGQGECLWWKAKRTSARPFCTLPVSC